MQTTHFFIKSIGGLHTFMVLKVECFCLKLSGLVLDWDDDIEEFGEEGNFELRDLAQDGNLSRYLLGAVVVSKDIGQVLHRHYISTLSISGLVDSAVAAFTEEIDELILAVHLTKP